MATTTTSPPMQPSTSEIQRAQALLATISSLLSSPDSTPSKPDLLHILPHLLAPLQRIRSPGQADPPSYRSLVQHVEGIITQLVSSLQDPTVPVDSGSGSSSLVPSQSLQVAEALRVKSNKERSRRQRQEKMMEQRRKRRSLAQQKRTVVEANMPTSAKDKDAVPGSLAFHMPGSVSQTDDVDTEMETSVASRLAKRIRGTIQSVSSFCTALDADAVSPGSFRIRLSELTVDDDQTSAKGSIRIDLENVGSAWIWLTSQHVDSDWETQVTNINLRSVTEKQKDAETLSKQGLSRSHLASSDVLLRTLSTRAMSVVGTSSLTSCILYVVSLRTLRSSVPPLGSQVYLQKSQEEELGMTTPESQSALERKIVLVGWAARESVRGVRWAWCKRLGDQDPVQGSGHWRAFVA